MLRAFARRAHALAGGMVRVLAEQRLDCCQIAVLGSKHKRRLVALRRSPWWGLRRRRGELGGRDRPAVEFLRARPSAAKRHWFRQSISRADSTEFCPRARAPATTPTGTRGKLRHSAQLSMQHGHGGAAFAARSCHWAASGNAPHAFFARGLNGGPCLEGSYELLGSAIRRKLDEGCLGHDERFVFGTTTFRRCRRFRFLVLRLIQTGRAGQSRPLNLTTPQPSRKSSISRRRHSQAA